MLASAPMALPDLVRRLAVAADFVLGAVVIAGVASGEVRKGVTSLYTHSFFYRETEPTLFWAAVAASGVAAAVCLVIAVPALSARVPLDAFNAGTAG